ncbi:MAG: sigma-70 family RNA polymerase sigma factor, partial [Phycisphaerales bacterium]|nr:sigma-70 family RNA polymerase sigma factor [Phycisphaerales bacterium]
MDDIRPDHITQALTSLTAGDHRAADALMTQVYEELRALASSYLRRESPDHTLEATALVHEAYLKLAGQDRARYHDRTHFFAIASNAIRRILVDHARARNAAKRGGGWDRVTLSGVALDQDQVDLIELDDALSTLASLSTRQALVVELRYFGGLTVAQVAEVLDLSTTTIEGDWAVAK